MYPCSVRSDFQVREDESLAHRLQEQECEQPITHFIKSFNVVHIIMSVKPQFKKNSNGAPVSYFCFAGA